MSEVKTEGVAGIWTGAGFENSVGFEFSESAPVQTPLTLSTFTFDTLVHSTGTYNVIVCACCKLFCIEMLRFPQRMCAQLMSEPELEAKQLTFLETLIPVSPPVKLMQLTAGC